MAPKLKLTYFNIEGAAEKVRVACKIGSIDFQDERVEFPNWPAMKPTTPYGQLPLLTVDDGAPISQSGAMLLYVGKLAGLYPSDPLQALRVDEVLGLIDDLMRAFNPSFAAGRTPQSLGYPADMSEADKNALVMKLRTALVAEGGDVHRFLGYFDNILKKNGSGFCVGDSPTIADCALLAPVRMMKSGRLDGIPANVMDGYPNVVTFYEKMMGLPALKAHYSS